MWKELFVSAATIAFMSTSCGDNPSVLTTEHNTTPSASERIGVENVYSWQSPGGTTFDFDAIDFPGTFYPEAIAQSLGKYCNKQLVLPKVTILIGPVEGFNSKTGQIDPNGEGRGITIMKTEKNTGKPVSLTIGIAGGYFQKLRSVNQHYYTSPHVPNEKVLTNALFDLNGSIAEEVGYHACLATVGTPLEGPNAQAESARFHLDFLKNSTVMFRPKGW